MEIKDFGHLQMWDPIVVEWVDIHVNGDSLDPIEYMENYEPCMRRTAGFFLGINKGHLFLCETDDRRANIEIDAERINAFPLGNITACQTLSGPIHTGYKEDVSAAPVSSIVGNVVPVVSSLQLGHGAYTSRDYPMPPPEDRRDPQ